MDFKIFVSYSSHDLYQVQLLQQQLQNTPLKVFIAEHSVRPSQELAPTIANAIEQSDLFVVLWSKNAKESDWVSQEIGRASALKKKILPLVLTEGLSLPGFISNLKYLAVYKDPQEALSAARDIAVSEYNRKFLSHKKREEEKQRNRNALVLMGLGAFLLWAFSQE